MHLVRSDPLQTQALNFESRHRSAVRKPIFVEWHNSEIFAVLSKECHRPYVLVPTFSQTLKSHRMFCALLPPMSAYSSSASSDYAPWFGDLLLETVMAEITTMSFGSFFQAAK